MDDESAQNKNSERADIALRGQPHHQGMRSGNFFSPKPADLAALLQPILAREGTIIAAYLFGSAAKGQMRVGSDVDVAVILDSHGPKVDRKQLFDRLLPLLCRAVRHDVHLVVLNDASYLLRVQVVHEGNLIHVANREKVTRFQMVSTALYAEFAPILEMTRSGLRQKLRERARA